MYKEIFIALCFIAIVSAYPSENVENNEPIEVAQVEADLSDSDNGGDLEGSESRWGGGWGRGGWGGGWGRGYGHYGGGWGGYGGWRGYGHHHHRGYGYWG